jgi:hypothetical protein
VKRLLLRHLGAAVNVATLVLLVVAGWTGHRWWVVAVGVAWFAVWAAVWIVGAVARKRGRR